MVENVEDLRAKLQFPSLGDREILKDREVKVHESWPNQAIRARVTKRIDRRNVRTAIKPGGGGMNLRRRVHARWVRRYRAGLVRIADEIRTHGTGGPCRNRGIAGRDEGRKW